MKIKFASHIRTKSVFILLIAILFWNCKSNKTAIAKDNGMALSDLETLLEYDAYRIDIEAAFPFNTAATTQVLNTFLLQNTGNSANRIDVRGDGNYIEIKNDSIKGYLPFFGERRLNAGRYGGTDAAIQFGGIIKDYEKVLNTKKGSLEIKFSTSQKNQSSENYQVLINIFPNKQVLVNITPTYRTFMRYSGTLNPITKAL